MSSTPTVETLSAKGHGGGGEGNFRGSRNAVISDASSLTHKKGDVDVFDLDEFDDLDDSIAVTPVLRPISNATNYYNRESKSNDQISAHPNVVADSGGGVINGQQTPIAGYPTTNINSVISPEKEQGIPEKTQSRRQSATQRSRRGSYDKSGGEGSGRSKSRLVVSVNEASLKLESMENAKTRATSSSVKNASYWNVLHNIGILLGCVFWVSPLTLIPRHNTILYPTYWFESILVLGVMATLNTALVILDIYAFLNCKIIISMRMVLRMFFWILSVYLIPYCMSYVVWSIFLDYNHPMPQVGPLSLFAAWIFNLFGIWVLIPSDLRGVYEFRQKLQMLLLYLVWWFVVGIQMDGLSFIFENLPSNLQWTIALMLPIAKELNNLVFSKLVFRMAGAENELAISTWTIQMNANYAMFVAIKLAQAEPWTVYAIMAMDFLLNFRTTYQIIQLHNKVALNENGSEDTKRKKKEKITELVLAETIDGLTPLAYAVGFSMAFYGPNAILIGNVGNGYWTYKPVEDIESLFTVLFSLVAVEYLIMLVNALCLWIFCKINFLKEFCRVAEKCWPILILKLSLLLYVFFATHDINLATDFTSQFNWITTEGRYNMIFNSTDLSDEEKFKLLSNLTF